MAVSPFKKSHKWFCFASKLWLDRRVQRLDQRWMSGGPLSHSGIGESLSSITKTRNIWSFTMTMRPIWKTSRSGCGDFRPNKWSTLTSRMHLLNVSRIATIKCMDWKYSPGSKRVNFRLAISPWRSRMYPKHSAGDSTAHNSRESFYHLCMQWGEILQDSTREVVRTRQKIADTRLRQWRSRCVNIAMYS